MREIIVLFLLTALVVQSQHISNDTLKKLSSKEADSPSLDQQRIDAESITRADTQTLNPLKRKLKEFEDHAEMKVETEKPELTSFSQTERKKIPSPTPIPMLVTEKVPEDKETEEISMTVEPVILPSPVPIRIDPDIVDGEDPECEEDTEKQTDKKSSSSTVPKKGVVYCGPSVAARKGVGNKTSTVTPRKGVGNNTSTVTPRKGVGNNTSTITPRKGVGTDNKSSSVIPRKGVGIEEQTSSVLPRVDRIFKNVTGTYYVVKGSNGTFVLTNSTEVDLTSLTLPPKLSDEVDSGVSNKSMGTDLNSLTSGSAKKSFSFNGKEDSMDYSSHLLHSSEATVSSTTATSPMPSPKVVNLEPAKPPIENPTSTEQYSPYHFKPTAATDSLAKESISSEEEEDNVSYTPAVIGIVLLVVIILTIMVVGYRRLQDVWMRRHYARMDFLIDGMYDM